LVRNILTAQHGRRIAVIVNEFGEELGIERAIVSENDGDGQQLEVPEWLELANGCLCCSMKGELVAGLEGLLKQRHRFDYILIETSGLANPGPVAAALWTDAELEAGVQLDGIVTVADARHLPRQLAAAPATHEDGSGGGGGISGPNEAQQQLAYADVVLLNKVDLEGEVALERVEAAVASINPAATILRTRHCAVDPSHILDLRALAGLRSLNGLDAAAAAPSAAATARLAALHLDGPPADGAAAGSAKSHHSHAQEPAGHDAGHHSHANAVTSVSLRLQQPLDLQRVRQWVEGLLWDRVAGGPDVFRMKGVLATADSPRQHLLQAVHELYDLTEGADWGSEGGPPCNRLVVIGCRLHRPTLEQQLLQCVASL